MIECCDGKLLMPISEWISNNTIRIIGYKCEGCDTKYLFEDINETFFLVQELNIDQQIKQQRTNRNDQNKSRT